MIVETLLVRLGGESGIDNAISAGDVLTRSVARSGYHVHTFRTYPAEIKGGPVMFQLRAGVHRVPSLGDQLDVLLAFNEEAWDLHHHALRPDGILVYDPGEHDAPQEFQGTTFAIPLDRMARDLNLRKGKNLIALGALSALVGFDFSQLQATVKSLYGTKRPEFIESNRMALLAGFQWVKDNIQGEAPIRLAPPDPAHEPELVMSGNRAIVAGALAAGCRYFAGYPITPASDILEEMAKRLPDVGGASLQTEDEIAAIASVVGASIAGVKAMTATSGPGFSLMQEMLGLATMAEVPLVVVNSMRAGPSTGMPTKMEQADLNIALYGGHGEAPRIVLAARSVQDCFYQSMQAFYLSETFQMPVILLTDQSLSHRTETLPMPNVNLVPVVERLRPSKEDAADYQRYRLTESGISSMAVPGFDPTPFTATGLEHNEYGAPNYTPEMHTAQLDKRGLKFEVVADALCGLEPPLGCISYGVPEAEARVGVLAWGSTAGVVREAVEEMAAEGHPVAALVPAVIHPLPTDRIMEFADGLRVIIVPEVNRTGQFAAWVKAHTELHLISLNKYGGLPFTPAEIRAKVMEFLVAEPAEPAPEAESVEEVTHG
ncbi:MAG TPA: 2-oxoacid:acceptor oxidoreductase subunit alpha [Anaerolineae bacterium]|nr:2-oxoacid:acceptor oxidoreductase subunit alpha [Anaerolineae bacterium]